MADMIGLGVFTSLGFRARYVQSGFALVLLWALGVVALCGALCYAELATMAPRSGGEYTFLSHMYGPAVGFIGGLALGYCRVRRAGGARRHGVRAIAAVCFAEVNTGSIAD